MDNFTNTKKIIELNNEFNNVFFSSSFIQAMVDKFKFCPAGLTLNTYNRYGEILVKVVTKKYGYDEHVSGKPDENFDEYKIYKTDISDEVREFMKDYLKKNHKDLFDKIDHFIQ